MNLEKNLDRLHAKITANRSLQLFTAFTRILLAVGFIPPSIKKIMHEPFTSLPDSNPVGHYFNALLDTGFYYEFIGWGQLFAAILLLFPRTAHIGALMFFPIIANIAVLTNSVGFAGTNYITALMFFACAYLVAWDYDRLKTLFFGRRGEKSAAFNFRFVLIPAFFALGGVCLASLIAVFGAGNLQQSFAKIAFLLAAIGALFGLLVTVHFNFMRVGELKNQRESL